MSFIISKLVWIAVSPLNLLVIWLTAGMILSFIMPKTGRFVSLMGVAAFLVVSVFPVANHYLAKLESAYSVPEELPDHIDGIIILGGALDTVLSDHHKTVSVNGAAERLLEGLALANNYQDAPVVYLGGEGVINPVGNPEAQIFDVFLGRYLAEPEDERPQVIYETRSRTTYENAVYGRELLKPAKEQNWILVTSAFHMRRAVETFKANGWNNITPYPVDYRSYNNKSFAARLDARGGFDKLYLVWHELLGTAYYRMTGKI